MLDFPEGAPYLADRLADPCEGSVLTGTGCGRCKRCFDHMAMAFESDGHDAIPVTHLGRYSLMVLTADQLAFINEYGYLPLSPFAATHLIGRLTQRGN